MSTAVSTARPASGGTVRPVRFLIRPYSANVPASTSAIHGSPPTPGGEHHDRDQAEPDRDPLHRAQPLAQHHDGEHHRDDRVDVVAERGVDGVVGQHGVDEDQPVGRHEHPAGGQPTERRRGSGRPPGRCGHGARSRRARGRRTAATTHPVRDDLDRAGGREQREVQRQEAPPARRPPRPWSRPERSGRCPRCGGGGAAVTGRRYAAVRRTRRAARSAVGRLHWSSLARAPAHVGRCFTAVSPLRVAVVGAGPAGIYAADILSKSGLDGEHRPHRAAAGSVRPGALRRRARTTRGSSRSSWRCTRSSSAATSACSATSTSGADLTLDELREHYDAVIFATGAIRDAALRHPRASTCPARTAPPTSSPGTTGTPTCRGPGRWRPGRSRCFGAGNVALDVARMLSKHAEDLLPTEIPENVHADPGRQPRHRRARVRPARPRAGEVRPARAARARPRAGRRRGRLPGGLRVRRGLDGGDPLVEPDQAGGQDPDGLDAEGAGGPAREPSDPPALPAPAGRGAG